VYNEVVADPVELSHEAGVIAMARSQALDTASSQFYFTLDNVADQLDGGYAVFGEVSEGFDFVQEIREGDRILVARVVDGDISSRTSEIATESDLLNDWINADNEVKVSYVLSIDEDTENENDDSDADSAEDDIVETSILDDAILASQITQTIDEEVEGEGEEEGEEEQAEENSESEDDDEGDEIASAVDEDEEEDSEEATEVAENDNSESVLDIDVVDSSFTTNIGTESDDVIDVFEISDAEPDSSFAIMGLAGDDEISGGNATDILSGNEGDDIVSGRDGEDLIRAGKGDDILIGGKGDDIIIGDHGADILTGGLGADSFILRADIVDGIDEIDQADLITDFNVADNDQIVVIANFIPSEGLTYELFDDDTVIRLSDSGFILGVVSDTSIEEVENNIVAVSADDYALRLG
ncbi:peptidylprolyl isomerase, partial [Okeania sp. SIO2B9]